MKKEIPKTETVAKSIVNQFAALSFDQKVELFTVMRDNMRQSYELESKKADERMCFLKESYQNLLSRP